MFKKKFIAFIVITAFFIYSGHAVTTAKSTGRVLPSKIKNSVLPKLSATVQTAIPSVPVEDRIVSCPALNSLRVLSVLISSYLQTQEKIWPIPNVRDGDHYDFIVVGAGSAGCVVANRLSEIPHWKVLVVEAGGEEPLMMSVPAFRDFGLNSEIDWQYRTQAIPDFCGGKPCTWPRGKVLGGSSVLNSMNYDRGKPNDYNLWEKMGNKGWSFRDVLPFFKKSENNLDPEFAEDKEFHGRGGYLSVQTYPYMDKNVHTLTDGYKELGDLVIDINRDKEIGFMAMKATQKRGERRSSNRAFLEPVRSRPNLHVLPNVRAARILVNPETREAYGVELIEESTRKHIGRIFADKEIIISAGAINSPQILMLSGIGPKNVLESLGIEVVEDLPVGQNFHNHLGAGIDIKLKNEASTVPVDVDDVKKHLTDYAETRTGPFASTGVNLLEGYIKSKYIPADVDYSDIQFATYTGIQPYENCNSTLDTHRPLSYYNVMHYNPAVLTVENRGNITISSKDPFESPLIYPNPFSEHDLEVLIDGLRSGVKLSETSALKNAGYVLDKTPGKDCKHFDFDTDEYYICLAKNYTDAGYHPVGTCKMGPNHDPTAVVNPQLQVNGIKGLRIADASIMPVTVRGSLNAVVIMIGERCADFIKTCWNESVHVIREVNAMESLLYNSLSCQMRNISSAV